MISSNSTLLAPAALITIVIQLSFFIIAYYLQIDTFTDFAGTSNFIVLALLSYFSSNSHPSRSTVITFCVVLWGIRLCGKDPNFIN